MLFFDSVELDFESTTQRLAFLGSALLGVLIRFKTFSTRAPPVAIFALFQLASFLMGMVWIYFLANIIVDLLMLMGMLTGVSVALLGLTVLSWGNSVGDAFASISISKKGFGEMALTGCIAGPVFNLMLGLGLTTVKCNLQQETAIEFSLKDPESK